MTSPKSKDSKYDFRNIERVTDPDFGGAVSFIRELDAINPGDRVAILCRVTTRGQKENGSLDIQKEIVRQAVRERGGAFAVTYSTAGIQADSEKWIKCLRNVFRRASDRKISNVVILSLSRLVRHPDSTKGDFQALPTPEQLKRIEQLAAEYGITIVSVLPPDATPSAEKSAQTRLSERAGRPEGSKSLKSISRKVRREMFSPLVVRERKAGHSLRETAEIVNTAMKQAGYKGRIGPETVRIWLAKQGKK